MPPLSVQRFAQIAVLPLSLTQPIHLQRAANSTEITLKFLYSKKSLAIEARPVGGDRKSRMDVTWSDLSAMRLLLTVSPVDCLLDGDPNALLGGRIQVLGRVFQLRLQLFAQHPLFTSSSFPLSPSSVLNRLATLDCFRGAEALE